MSGSGLDTRQFKPWPAGAWLVGGAVRDALLGAAPADLDWLVADPRAAALELAALTGGSPFELDAERGHWRVALPGGAVHDLAPPRPGAGSFEADLALRDLTLNAMALDAAGRLVDPLGGLADLRAGRVRMTSRAALEADAVRPLRAARFAGTLGFALEAATRAAVVELGAAQAAGARPLPAAERVGAELSAMLAAPRAAHAFQLLAELRLTRVYLPELEAARGVDQGRGFHHLDVLDHSLEALDQLLHGFPDAVAALRWATLLHDVGKPATAERGPAGQVTFHGHDRVGAELTRERLRRLRLPNEVVERATKLVRYHMLPLPRGERAARRFVHRRRELLPDLLKLMIADREAARGPLASEAQRRAYRLALGQVIALLEEPAPPRPLLSGREVMGLLGLEPGPRVGEALALVAEARAVGDVRDAEEARALLLRYAEAQRWL
ncbi:MAG: HD domain-containing protein [Deinococcales bacterium]|nr:HD domain-containing protein [Deinococcales bacterium]